MQNDCNKIHKWANALPIFKFPFNETGIPLNGLYILFEKGEYAHGANRIVRVGTHTGQNQLRSRLRQHFLTENKDRSIFRKNIGRCILNRANDPFLEKWELDLTPKLSRDRHSSSLNLEKQKTIEREVSKYMQDSFSFVVLQIDDKENRLELESKIISTVSLCEECKPSKKWLGLYSPKGKIKESGLWLVNELYKQPLSGKDFEKLKEFAAKEKLEIVLSAPVPAFTQEFRSGRQDEAGGRGVGGIPPAEPREFRSDINQKAPFY